MGKSRFVENCRHCEKLTIFHDKLRVRGFCEKSELRPLEDVKRVCLFENYDN